ncbi:MAG: choice-of-anchor B family protein [Melioribacteraceae bacterium]|nr:choice-of-anchor B family protein [Melioribacteraceae bacterium]
MKKIYFIIIPFILLNGIIYSQQIFFNGNFNPYPEEDYSDIWGYVDSQGNEYAFMGVYTGTTIVKLGGFTLFNETAFIPGPNSIWRDIKVHDNYAYIITEGTGNGAGLQIVDLSLLPDTAFLAVTYSETFTRAHNIFIDEGFAYVVGTSGGGGIHILDLSDPINPVETAYYGASGYVHDVYVWSDTLVACAEDSYDLVDITDKSNPQKISESPPLPGRYAHSGWMTEDKKYFVACEEFNVDDITIWNLEDRTNWELVSQFELPGSSPVHNIFMRGSFAHVSYYADGYVVLDISNPENPVIVDEYDTDPLNSSGYNGAWGCYPYLPSGKILISDISTGLYVFSFDEGETPVELTSFSANQHNDIISLVWKTASETNNKGFEIERKFQSESGEWQTIGFAAGKGTTNEEQNYSFKDEILNVSSKDVNYRLKQIDFDGSFEYSKVLTLEINLPDKIVLHQNYPNPFNPKTKIKISIPFAPEESIAATLKIYNTLGEEIVTLFSGQLEAGNYEFEFDASTYSSGIYLAMLKSKTFSESIKMLLLK